MIRISECETNESWIERGRASGAVTSTWGAETDSVPAFEVRGWDPYEVWLRRVEMPRRHRANGREAPPMDVSNTG